MPRALSVTSCCVSTLCGLLLLLPARMTDADEGMWLYNAVPREALKQRYGFEPTDAWLDHLRLSSVRFNSGGSGSFVSSNGLVMTNHHVGADALQKLSSEQRDLLKTGFFARTAVEELKCVDLELNVLTRIENVTEQVNAAVKPGMSAGDSQKARRGAINTLEQENAQKSGLRSDVITLYQGGQYHLYQFKKYTDVRLVFAPEKEIAFFGGDPDNFEYPRFDLDICFFRVYENDKPAKVEHFLAWSKNGADDGELIFVSGHPGRTNRLNTVAHLEYLRDVVNPDHLNMLRRHEIALKTFADRSLENMRRAQDDLFGVQNSRKARLGGLAGLQDPEVMAKKKSDELALRDAVEKDAKLKEKYGDAWEQIQKSLQVATKIRTELNLFENGSACHSDLFFVARTLVRMAEEDAKPNAERLREFAQAGRPSLEQRLFSEAPIYADLEMAKLADSLSMMVEKVGPDHPLAKEVLAGKSPSNRAAELISGSTLTDVAVRRKLAAGGAAAINSSTDPMIKLVRSIDRSAREMRTVFEQQVEEPQRQAYAKINAARFAILGSSTYPDATFTLRLAFGTVKGYTEGGRTVLPWTTIGGTFEHAAAHGNKEPFALPESWLKRKDQLNPTTPYNFVATADIIGGNSGSPVVNRKGEVVGIIFDGNIQSLVLDYAYSDQQARAVSVHSAAIQEALRKVYDASSLANELGK
ncbi:MAG: S46 family peptidase [Planctomycetes bacterium]|nr:S46 family peptidase [Planctomycetota bacterium]